MAFDDELSEFYNTGEFAESITHERSSIDVMFFDVREDVDGVYINHTYFTAPASTVTAMIKGDLITRGTVEYRIKSITDHNSDKTVKIIELEHIRDTA